MLSHGFCRGAENAAKPSIVTGLPDSDKPDSSNPVGTHRPGGRYHRAMFSYRHAFHAGNHADVLKHLTLIATLRHLMQKSGALTLIDTHAGAGIYRLDDAAAQTSGEALAGIARLQAAWAADSNKKQLPAPAQQAQAAIDMQAPVLLDYLRLIASFNRGVAPGAAWKVYPGSPFIMHALMTEPERAAVHDRLRLFELHPSDWLALQAHVAQLEAGRQVSMAREDGFAGLKALLPPPAGAGGSRRALVLIDPSYEIKSDYAKVAAAVQDGLKRFVTGAYLVLFPRTQVKVLFLLVVIGVYQIPAWWFIGGQVAWDFVAQGLGTGGNVARLAHLGGYAFGIGLSLALLATGLLKREVREALERRIADARRAHDDG